MAIDVLNRQRLARVDGSRVASIAAAALKAIDKDGASLTVVFLRDSGIRKLNRNYRGADRATDVLSFPTTETGSPGAEAFDFDNASEHLGDIVISTDTALRQSEEAGHSFQQEIDELVIHGVLHLCGYDHEADSGEMNRLELTVRERLLDPA